MSTENTPPTDSTARQGKIARLPHVVREELNRRIQNCEAGKNILDWLNCLPETMVVLEAQFDGRPISDANLSGWKAGGDRDWQAKQEAVDLTRSFCAGGAELDDAASLNENLAFRAAAQIAVILRDFTPTGDPESRLESIGLLCRQIFRLRRGDYFVKSLKIEQERLALEREKFEEQRTRAKNSAKHKVDPVTMEDFRLIEQRDNLL